MSEIRSEVFGRLPDGRAVERYSLVNSSGLTARIINFGGIITELWVSDARGERKNIVAGFESLEGYLQPHPYFGAIIGRYANRIANGRFSFDGKAYTLATNNGPNALHGGLKGFDKQLWHGRVEGRKLLLRHVSKDGDEGYPGDLTVQVEYFLGENRLEIDYMATTTQPTVLNLTNHSYFNLAGGGSILDHEVQVDADRYTPVNDKLIPTGELAPVAGTALDFREPHAIGERIGVFAQNPGGYDHNFVLNSGGGQMARAARVREPRSGRVLEVHTTEPGMQLYTGNFLDGSLRGHGGLQYNRHSAFCLETQHFPDSPNHPEFPSPLLRPGETFRSSTAYVFKTG